MSKKHKKKARASKVAPHTKKEANRRKRLRDQQKAKRQLTKAKQCSKSKISAAVGYDIVCGNSNSDDGDELTTNDDVSLAKKQDDEIHHEIPLPKSSDNINQYRGWTVPESNYRIPVLSAKDDELEPERFYQNYVRRRRPVVIRGQQLPNELLHLTKWKSSNEDMIQRAGDATIKVEKRSNSRDSFGKGTEVGIKFSEFLKLIQNGDSMHYLTTQDVEADKDGRPKLLSPFMERLRGGQNGSDTEAFPLRPKLMGNLVPQNINIWIGNSPNGASSGLHHDYHDNLYIVLRGTKRFRLYSPSDTENMYTRGKLAKVHGNGRINYEGELTTAYGADPNSYAAAKAAKAKEAAEERLAKAEKAAEEGNPGAEEELEKAELALDEAMEAILDAETGGDDMEDEEDAFCLETAREEDVEGIDVDEVLSCTDDEDGEMENMGDDKDFGENRIVDKTIKNPNNFSMADPSVLDDPQKLQIEFPKMLEAKAAFCECTMGDMLYLPASWFHEVQSSSSNSNSEETASKGHMAFNYWFHPPDAPNNFEKPYTTDFWPNDYADRFK